MSDFYTLSYQGKDLSGRTLATQILKNNYIVDNTYYPEDDYSFYDMSFDIVQTYKSTSYMGEVKLRAEYDSNKFKTIILEKEKFDNMHRLPNKEGKRLIYMTIWNDNVMDIVNINKEPDLPLVKRLLPLNNEHKEIKVWKDVWEIPVKDCTRLTL